MANKNNIHEEGMGVGTGSHKSKSKKDEWVEEEFGKSIDSVSKRRQKNVTRKKSPETKESQTKQK